MKDFTLKPLHIGSANHFRNMERVQPIPYSSLRI